MKVRCIVAGFSAVLLVTAAAFGKDEVLTWKKLDGVEKGKASELKSKGPAFDVVRKKPDGQNELVHREAPAGPMRGPAVYTANLSPEVRRENKFVGFLLSGTAGAEPDNGTIIYVDGANLGFKRVVVGNRVRAQVYALGVNSDGAREWKSVNWGLPIDPATDLTAPAKMIVRLDQDRNTWALFHSDVLIAENLPLLTEKGPPKLSVRPGIADTDEVKFQRAWSATKPDPRQDKFLPVEKNGRIDYAKAQERNDPRLKPATSKNHR